MTSEKRSGTEGVVDMELQCVRCKARLYIAVSQASAVIASLERHGRGDPDLCLWASAAHSVQATAEERLSAGGGSCVGEPSSQRDAHCAQQGLALVS